MKRLFSICTTLLLSYTLFGQNQFGIFAGGQATGARYTILNQKQKNTLKYGFQAGVNMKVPFDVNLFFAPAAFYSLKGYQVKFTEFAFPPDPDAADNNTTIHSFELAPLLQYDFGSNPNHFFIKAGPSLDFLLLGKEKYNLKAGGSVNRSMKFSNGDYGRFSANLLAQLGYETNSGLMIFLQYTHGAASISNADGGPKIRNRVYGLSIGKYINRKKIVIDTKNKE